MSAGLEFRDDAPAPAFPRLFSPYRAGRLDLSGRLVMLPHGNAMVQDGVPTELDLAYFQARAEGLAMVITGATVGPRKAAFRTRNLVEAFNPEAIPMLRRRADLVHRLGARIVGQLCHLGRETTGYESEFAPMGASARRSPRDPYAPHVMDDADIEETIAGFVEASRNVQAAGYDGVEMHGAHGYLFAQFLSAATNERADKWGGTPEKRMRLLLETVERVRAACGDEFIVGVRLSADEETADGLGIRDSVGIGKALAAQGVVDYLNITVGMRGNYVKDATVPAAPAARAARIMRAETGIPVIVGQKIADPHLAERLLEEGAADMIGMARALIADPGFARKAKEGRSDRIRPCIGLNQDCRLFSPHLHCSVNPETGRETRAPFNALLPTPQPKRIAVVGGGPAGLDAARIAALRGHDVTLFEQSSSLGGQFLLAASLPHRGGLMRMVDHLARELRLTDARIELGIRIDSLAALGGDFDAAIVATGAQACPLMPPGGGVAAMSWWDVLHNGAPPPTGCGHAVFVDEGTGFWFSYGVTEMLGQAAWRVTFVTTSAMIGAHIPAESVTALLPRLGANGTAFRVLSTVEQGEDGVLLVNLASGEEEPLACDLVVYQTGRQVVPGPAAGAAAGTMAVHHIGDCVSPRRITHALFEAQQLARTI